MPARAMDPPEPAPSRGQYDRSLSRMERQQRQRERLLFWAAREYHARGGELTVQHVVEAAGSGRNTFYEYFDDLDHALEASGRWSLERVEHWVAPRIDEARTPIARLKMLAAAWFEAIQRDPAPFAVMVRPRPGAGNDALTYATQSFSDLLAVALGHEKLERRCQAVPHLHLAVAHAVAGLTQWSLAGGIDARQFEAATRTILLEVFR